MSDSLTVFGTDYTGVTGIKAKGTGNGTLTYIRPVGTKSISENGTGIDVTEYASVNVAVPAQDNTLQFKVSITLDEPFTPGSYWGYDIANIAADHTIVVVASSTGPKLYVKLNGSWVQVSKAYVKSNGSWSQVSLDAAFDSSKRYVKA